MENLSISVIMAMGCYIVAILGLLFFSWLLVSELYRVLKNLKDYSSSLVSNIEIHNHKYIVMTDKDVKEYIRLSFETNKDIKKI